MNGSETSELTTPLNSLPTGMLIALGVAAVLGLVLWLLGRQMARPACAVCGLILASLIAWIFAAAMNNGLLQLVLVAGCGIAGCLLSILLFRIWMGLTCGLLLALAVPLAGLTWMDTPYEAQPIDLQIDEAPDQPRDFMTQFKEQLQEWRTAQQEDLQAWWDGLGRSTQRTIMAAAGTGMVIGFLVGLIFPYLAASFETALVGGYLMMLAVKGFLGAYDVALPEWLETSPRGGLALLGLITALGMLVQWTISRRKAE